MSGCSHRRGGMTEKLQNIIMYNCGGERRHCAGIKIIIYGNNLIDQQSNFQCNQQTQRVFVIIHEEES